MAIPIRGTTWTAVGGEVIDAGTGAGFAGTVTVLLQLDNGTQTSIGTATAAGNGTYTIDLSATQTDAVLVKLTFTGTGAVPALVQVPTITAQQQQALAATSASGSVSVRAMLTQALKRINVLQSNQAPTPDMLQDAFDRFNDWIDSVCANDRLAIFSITRTLWTLVSGQQDYTVGVGGDINITRPIFVDHVNFMDLSITPAYERPLISLTDDAWAGIPIKSQTSTYPTYCYYNPTFTSGAFATLSLWLIPTSAALQGVIYAPTAVTRFATLNDTIALPPGYNRFFRDNIAVELASEFRENMPIDPGLVMSARESKANIKRANTRLMDMGIDPMWLNSAGHRSNIYLGY